MTKKSPKDEEHSKYGASKAERWLSCPRSIQLAEQAPEQPPSPYAEEGTKAHKCLEFLLKNRKRPKAALKLAAKQWNQEMISHAEATVKWVEEQAGPGDIILGERKVDSSSFTTEGQFGTLDIAIVREFSRLTVVDYKYGAGVAVDPGGYDGRGNPQLIYYGLALSEEYDHNFAEVELVVIQPRAHHESGETIRSLVLPIEELLPWKYNFRVGVLVCEQETPPIKAGPWCKFCPAAVICPELKDESFKKAQVVFSDEVGLCSAPKPAGISPHHLGTILDGIDRLEDWIGKVREHAFHVLQTGGKIKGYKLVPKRAQRKWRDENASAREARKRFGALAFTTPKLLSPAQLEKMGKGSDGAAEWVKARVTAESSGLTLTREDDARPATSPMEEIFGDVIDVKSTVMQGRLPSSNKTKSAKGKRAHGKG